MNTDTNEQGLKLYERLDGGKTSRLKRVMRYWQQAFLFRIILGYGSG